MLFFDSNFIHGDWLHGSQAWQGSFGRGQKQHSRGAEESTARKAQPSVLDWTRAGHSKKQNISHLNLGFILDVVQGKKKQQNKTKPQTKKNQPKNQNTTPKNPQDNFRIYRAKPTSQLTILIPLDIQAEMSLRKFEFQSTTGVLANSTVESIIQ